MYELGQHFKFDYKKIKPNPECVFQGKKYRFTVLTERLIRIEYNENGVFLDEPTLLIRNRNFPKFNFDVKQDKNYIEIKTSYFKLSYTKERKLSSSNLTLNLSSSKEFKTSPV